MAPSKWSYLRTDPWWITLPPIELVNPHRKNHDGNQNWPPSLQCNWQLASPTSSKWARQNCGRNAPILSVLEEEVSSEWSDPWQPLDVWKSGKKHRRIRKLRTYFFVEKPAGENLYGVKHKIGELRWSSFGRICRHPNSPFPKQLGQENLTWTISNRGYTIQKQTIAEGFFSNKKGRLPFFSNQNATSGVGKSPNSICF